MYMIERHIASEQRMEEMIREIQQGHTEEDTSTPKECAPEYDADGRVIAPMM